MKHSIPFALLLGFFWNNLLYAATTSTLLVVSKAASLQSIGNSIPGTKLPTTQLKKGTVVIGLRQLTLGSNSKHDAWQISTIDKPRIQGIISASSVVPFSSWANKLRSSGLISKKAVPNQSIPTAIRLADDSNIIHLWEKIQNPFAENVALPENERLPDPYFARAVIWNRAGNYAAAVSDYLDGINYARNTNQSIFAYEKHFKDLSEASAKLRTQPVPPNGTNDPSVFMAFQHFSVGCSNYFSRNYEQAIKSFNDAILLNPSEPIHWYYRAVSHHYDGDLAKAQYDALMGAHFEKALTTQRRRTINKALLRVQGAPRIWLEQFRLGSPSNHIVKSFNKS